MLPTGKITVLPKSTGGRVSKKQSSKNKKQIVVIKSKNDIPPVVNSTKLFCRFKMDGCGHCVDSQADWDKVCQTVAGAVNPECMIAEIETKLLPYFKMRDGFKPEGFPTHAIFIDGRHVEDADDRSVEGLMQTLNKHKFLKRQQRRRPTRRRSFQRRRSLRR